MRTPFPEVMAITVTLISCGGAPPPPPAGAGDAAPGAAPAPAEAATPEPPPAPGKQYAVPLPEAEAAQQLGADARKLTQIQQLSPKSREALLETYLWKPVAECEGLKLAPVEAAPGLFVPAKGPAPQVRADLLGPLKDAAALAKQRGHGIEVLAGHETVADAVKRWNQAALDAAIEIANAVKPEARKEKSVMGAARKRLDLQADPRAWASADPCKAGRLAGTVVDVQLVALAPGGGRGKVLVKAGPEGDVLDKGSYMTSFWDQAQGRSHRLLNEVMTAGKFVRQCSRPSRFTAMPELDGTWRCREGNDSWEPENRPIAPWQ